MDEPVSLPPLRVIAGRTLGPQVHDGKRPTKAGMLPLFMEMRHPRYGRRRPVKPGGGLWTSTHILDAPLCSDWQRWKDGEGYEGKPGRSWLLVPQPEVRLLEIDREKDLYAIVGRWSHVTYPYLDQQYRYGRTWHSYEEIDHCAVAAAGYAGVHLTDAGQWATRLSHPLSLYGWDAESTVWYRWAFVGDPVLVDDPSTIPASVEGHGDG